MISYRASEVESRQGADRSSVAAATTTRADSKRRPRLLSLFSSRPLLNVVTRTPIRRVRKSGSRPRYGHAEGYLCSCVPGGLDSSTLQTTHAAAKGIYKPDVYHKHRENQQKTRLDNFKIFISFTLDFFIF